VKHIVASLCKVTIYGNGVNGVNDFKDYFEQHTKEVMKEAFIKTSYHFRFGSLSFSVSNENYDLLIQNSRSVHMLCCS